MIQPRLKVIAYFRRSETSVADYEMEVRRAGEATLMTTFVAPHLRHR